MSTKRKQSSEAKSSEVRTSEAVLDFDQYVAEAKVNRGLVASFKYEARKDASLLEPKTKEDWDKAFQAQSARVYK